MSSGARLLSLVTAFGFTPVMRRLLTAIAIAGVLAACGDRGDGPLAAGPPSPSPTPTPQIALDLMNRVRQMTAVAQRVDQIEVVKVKLGTIPNGLQLPSDDPNEDVWVVAVVGEVVTAGGRYPCGRWVFDLSGGSRGSSSSALKMCQPYFSTSLVPAPAPVRCGPEPLGYRYPGGSPTTPGPVALVIARDDGWAMPSQASSAFLYEVPEESTFYYEAFCRAENIVAMPGTRDVVLSGLGSPRISGPVPPGKAQLWLKNFHAVQATAGTASVTVVIEPRKGFEIASFDWRAVAPEGGYVRFEFVDASGKELIPFRVANGP